MLDGVDAIDWSAYEHAYGPATDVPAMLRELASEDPKRAGKAQRAFEAAVNHQGHATPAAVPAVPFLVELARARPRAALLALLADLACGGFHGNQALSGRFDELPHPSFAPLRAAVLAARDVFVAGLADPDAGVRAAAALGLGVLVERADDARVHLLGRLDVETDAPTLATVILALGSVGDAAVVDRLAALRAHAAKPVQLAAAIALARLRPDEAELVALVGRAFAVKAATRGVPWNAGELGDLGTQVALHGLASLGAIPALERLIGRLPLSDVMRPLLFATLGPQRPYNALPLAAVELPAAAVPVLQALARRYPPPTDYMGTPSVGESWGLLSLPRLVGVVPARTLDRVVDGEPVWRTAFRVREGELPVARWEAVVAALSADDVDDLARDLIGPPFPYHLSSRWAGRYVDGFDRDVADDAAFATLALVALRRLPTPALDAWMRAAKRLGGQGIAVVDAWTERCVAEGREPDPALNPVVRKAIDGTHLAVEVRRRVLARIPEPRRAAIALSLDPELLITSFADGLPHVFLRGCLPIADLAPSPALRERILAYLAEESLESEPDHVDREVVDALTPAFVAFGAGTAALALEAAETARDADPRMAAVLDALARASA